MAARKLTAKFLGDETGPSKTAAPPEGVAQVEHWDSLAPGLGVRIGKGGKRSFVLWYRFAGKARRDTLKPAYPALSLEDAREEARQTARDIAAGRDPRDRRNPKPQPEVEAPMTYVAAVEDYVRRYQEGQEQNKTAREVKRALLNVGTGWSGKTLPEIAPRDIRRALETIRDGSDERRAAPYMANRTYAYLKTFFRWAEEPGIDLVERSPMTGLRRPWSGEETRDRWFNDEELAAIWAATDSLSVHAAGLVKLLILTGKRKSAVASMRWEDISETGFWAPPQDRRRKRGNKRTHAVPLSSLAHRIVKSMPKLPGNPYVFPGRVPGDHLKPGKRLTNDVREASKVEDFYPHGLRHTMETQLGALGVAPHIRDLLLDHAPLRGAGSGYDHHGYERELQDAMNAWSDHLQHVLREQGIWQENVEPLRG